jgi:hypothetical protein
MLSIQAEGQSMRTDAVWGDGTLYCRIL